MAKAKSKAAAESAVVQFKVETESAEGKAVTETYEFVIDSFIVPGIGKVNAADLVKKDAGDKEKEALAALVARKSFVIKKVD